MSELINTAQEWCEKARELLNIVSAPFTDRWEMGTRMTDLGKALKTLSSYPKSNSLNDAYHQFTRLYSSLGNRAKVVVNSKDEKEKKAEPIRIISKELAELTTEVNAVIKKIEFAKTSFSEVMAPAKKQLKALRSRFKGQVPIEQRISNLGEWAKEAQTDVKEERYLDGMEKMVKFDQTAQEIKRYTTSRYIKEVVLTDLVELKNHKAFTADENKKLIWEELKGLVETVEITIEKAQSQLEANRYDPAFNLGTEAHFECQRIAEIATQHARYVGKRVEVERLISTLPKDNAAINNAIKDKAIGDYTAEVVAAKKRGERRLYDEAMALLEKAERDCLKAEEIQKEDLSCANKLEEAQILFNELPAKNSVIEKDILALAERMRLAKEKLVARDFKGVDDLVLEIKATFSILAKLAKDDVSFTSKAAEMGKDENTQNGLAEIRKLWEELRTRAPEEVPKAIESELNEINQLLEKVAHELKLEN